MQIKILLDLRHVTNDVYSSRVQWVHIIDVTVCTLRQDFTVHKTPVSYTFRLIWFKKCFRPPPVSQNRYLSFVWVIPDSLIHNSWRNCYQNMQPNSSPNFTAMVRAMHHGDASPVCQSSVSPVFTSATPQHYTSHNSARFLYIGSCYTWGNMRAAEEPKATAAALAISITINSHHGTVDV